MLKSKWLIASSKLEQNYHFIPIISDVSSSYFIVPKTVTSSYFIVPKTVTPSYLIVVFFKCFQTDVVDHVPGTDEQG
jgi:hypothetical protein